MDKLLAKYARIREQMPKGMNLKVFFLPFLVKYGSDILSSALTKAIKKGAEIKRPDMYWQVSCENLKKELG